LQLALEHLRDEGMLRQLKLRRGARGRDDYPVDAMWSSLVAMVVFGHPSIESMRRELARNAQMRRLCGFCNGQVPSASAYSRFMSKLDVAEIDEMFAQLVQESFCELEGFGESLAVDGKAVESHARGRNPSEEVDGRRDLDADFGVKTYHNQDGSRSSKIWFGYAAHLLVDTNYELPVGYSVTPASHSEVIEAESLLRRIHSQSPHILNRCETLAADRGYDSEHLIHQLQEVYGIKAVIDIRNMWRDKEETRLLGDWPNVTYDYRGRVYCFCPETGIRREMAYAGYEKDREALKYRCPAWQYQGINCRGNCQCPVNSSLRIKRSFNPRIFTSIARSSFKWDRIYGQRTAVERVNSRLDVSFGFEHHFVRGLRKMKIKTGIALSVMLAMALGHVRNKRQDRLRSLVQPA